MIKEMDKNDFIKVKDLFQEVFINLNGLAVINGDSNGRIWVDDIDDPRTGLLVDNIWTSYLAGDPSNKSFNKDARKVIKEIIFPEAAKIGEEANPEFNNNEWVIYYDDEVWNKVIEEEFNIKDYLILKRCYYKADHLAIANWREKIPEGFKVEFVDSEFLEKGNLSNMSEVTNWIKESWKTTEDFLKRGFGFCLVHSGKEIVSYGMADWATENKIEMGIGTIAEYRRQGFATIVVSAAVDYCINRNLDLGWHCSTHNTASWKTAEKAGFNKVMDYTAAIGCFDEFQNLIENSWYKALYLDQPEEGLRYIEQAVEHERFSSNYWILYALILARNKKNEKAFEIFEKVINEGVQNPTRLLEDLSTREDLVELREDSRWKEIKSKLEELINDKREKSES